jgi:hypothetical protein
VRIPEAPMHKDRSLPFWQRDIGRSGQAPHISPKTKPFTRKRVPQPYLGLGVLVLIVRHHSGFCLTVNNVCHAPEITHLHVTEPIGQIRLGKGETRP